MKSWKLEAIILAIGMLVMGYFIKQGLDTFSGKDRVVNVKGLAEMEVPANKVTWPLMYKDLGNEGQRIFLVGKLSFKRIA